ncbi:polysaccharide deacetylase family protein [Anoxybacterium hadale]|uniref:Polysaccharide deacetylase family protein n=1 Tax=Anoxybacterium hadale TaxID=3408580 RepID=A0ACD1A955_9FIRM|nr:polysaccharide deacetylase family protein [Clostridiales bacterium]
MSFTALMYHEIRSKETYEFGLPSPIEVRQKYEDQLPPPLFVSAEDFAIQMEYLYQNHYHTLTLDEVKSYYDQQEALPEKSVLLTFDDCYQSLSFFAYPILKQYNFHAVSFVVSGWLNEDRKPFTPEKSICLTEAELIDMNDVFEYANHTDQFHTRTGTAVSKVMEAADDEFSQDLDRCNAIGILDNRDVFAYPFGLYEERNVDLLRKKGFRLAFTSQGGKNDKSTDPMLLKRNVVPYFLSLEGFKEIIE